MDEVLQPVLTKRGKKMVSRHYRPEIVERVREERAGERAECAFTTQAEEHARRAAAKVLSRTNVELLLTTEEFTEVAILDCLFCGTAPAVRELAPGCTAALHNVVRITDEHPFNIENAAPCCDPCLLSKGEMSVREYIAHCRKIVARQAALKFF